LTAGATEPILGLPVKAFPEVWAVPLPALPPPPISLGKLKLRNWTHSLITVTQSQRQ
ncbi:Kinesin-like protein KIF19, partial [Clarias magur]